MKTYTMQEACNALAIDTATLFRWMRRAGMKVETDEQDKRRRVLSHSQLAQLAKLHHRSLAQQTAKTESIDETRLAQLEQRIDALERAMQETRQVLARLTAERYSLASPNEKTAVASSQRVAFASSTLPDGYVLLHDLLKEHGLLRQRQSITRYLKAKDLLKTGNWKMRGHPVNNALDEAGQAEFMKEFGNG